MDAWRSTSANGAEQLGGVAMGDGFLDTLTEPLTPKEYIENESRLEDGKRVVLPDVPRCQSRELTLAFTIEGEGPTLAAKRSSFLRRRGLFLRLMHAGRVVLRVPAYGDEMTFHPADGEAVGGEAVQSGQCYRLVYTGRGSEYALNPIRTFCKMMLKFTEPNPADRAGV